ncbi:MAG: hypothetical protein J6M93_02435 [Succinivibrio sp.]|nr:hypothetical protein [Succinivibrio sp.]
MSDKLDWMNNHLVLLLHKEVAGVLADEHLELETELEELAAQYPDSEDYLAALVKQKRYKDACHFLAYNSHHRAAAWWGYMCVVDLLKELKIKPANDRDIADIGKPRPLRVPDWAKPPKLPQPDDPSPLLKQIHDARVNLEKMIKDNCPKDILDMINEGMAVADQTWREQAGMTPMECIQKAVDSFKGDVIEIDRDNSPILKAKAELEAKIEKVRQETVDIIKKSLPPVDSAKVSKRKQGALDALFKYIVAPDQVNAQECLKIGNQIPDKPEGMASLVGFWSYGDLSPDTKNFVKTPVGLMSNGLNGLLLMCALAKGGVKDFDKRFKSYYELGVDILSGRNSWSAWVENKKVPHIELTDEVPVAESKSDDLEASLIDAASHREEQNRKNMGTAHPSIDRFRG